MAIDGVPLATHGLTASMSRRDNCYDNEVVERFFAFEHELGATADWRTRDAVAVEVAEFVEIWYSRERRHSSPGYQSLAAYEAQQSSAGAVRRVT